MTPFAKFAEMLRRDRARQFEKDFREANAKTFAAWDAERAKGYGTRFPHPDHTDMNDDINSRTYGGLKRD